MRYEKQVVLTRDVAVTEIPAGTVQTLKKGERVAITQSLGGAYTAMTEMGYMVRIAGEDADAIGESPVSPEAAPGSSARTTDEQVWDKLRTCYDPEIPVNIVELGLVYACELKDLPDGGKAVGIKFTLTAPGCGMGDTLARDIRDRVLAVPGVREADVQVIFEPQWNMNMMSDAAKLQLGMM